MADLWSDYTDMLISEIDKGAAAKSKLSLRKLLTNPGKFATQPSAAAAISSLREAARKYLDMRRQALSDDERALEDRAVVANAVTDQVNQNLSVQAKQGKIPLIRPVAIDRDLTREEHILIDSYDNSTVSLIEKLVGSSMLIADLTTTYKSYKVGEWFFSGHKNYLLSVFMPRNSFMLLEGSSTELLNLIDAAADFVKG